MIVVRIYGGLGNQMFQYAAGRRLALWHGVPLHLDISWFAGQSKRRFELGALDVDATVLSDGELAALAVSPPVLAEKAYHADRNVLAAPHHCVLDGYWQSPVYFSDIEPVIRADFQAITGPTEFEQETAELMGQVAAPVTLHVRRGDYVTERHATEFHGVCGPVYYRRAMTLMRRLVPGTHFFLFSDDPDWAEENLAAPDTTTVRAPERALPVESVRLMSLTRHHIIANSSYSWWGAWLANAGEGGVTIAPRPWFAQRTLNTDDLLVPSWITVGNA